MDKVQREIQLNNSTGKYELIDLLPGQQPDVIRVFSSPGAARSWSETYGFPMQQQDPQTEATNSPVQLPQRDISNYWYNNL